MNPIHNAYQIQDPKLSTLQPKPLTSIPKAQHLSDSSRVMILSPIAESISTSCRDIETLALKCI